MVDALLEKIRSNAVNQMDQANEIYEVVRKLGELALEEQTPERKATLTDAMRTLLKIGNEIVKSAQDSVDRVRALGGRG
jgi:Na+/phosphate symporter